MVLDDFTVIIKTLSSAVIKVGFGVSLENLFFDSVANQPFPQARNGRAYLQKVQKRDGYPVSFGKLIV